MILKLVKLLNEMDILLLRKKFSKLNFIEMLIKELLLLKKASIILFLKVKCIYKKKKKVRS